MIRTKRFITLTLPLSIALILIGLLLKVPPYAVGGESFQLQERPLANQLVIPARALTSGSASSATLSCREGLAGAEPYLSMGIDIQALGGGVYLDFHAHAPAPQPGAMEFIQVVRLKQNKDGNGNYLPSYTTWPPLSDSPDGLGPVIASAPSSLWLFGNEPDRGPDVPGGFAQDDTFPDIYARAYHDVYYFIKQRDPTAQVGIAGLVEVTPGRLQYLDIVRNTYAALYGGTLPVDVWNMHLYILPETPGIGGVALGTDPSLAYGFAYTHSNGTTNIYTLGDHDNLSLFDSQVRRMRQWMKDRGQQDKPLLLSEFSLLYNEDVTDEFGNNYTMARATAFLTKTFNYLATASDPAIGMPSDGNRLVQQWVWFGTNYYQGFISNLVTNTAPLTFTSVGNMFRANVLSRPLQPNLLPWQVTASAPILAPSDASVTATLSAQIVNNGNQLVTAPLTVTFYSDAALTQAIGSVVVTDGIPGCARRRTLVSVAWPDLTEGSHPYWIKVDSSGTIAETTETDNVAGGQVFVGSYGVYLPMVTRNFP